MDAPFDDLHIQIFKSSFHVGAYFRSGACFCVDLFSKDYGKQAAHSAVTTGWKIIIFGFLVK